MQFHIMLMTAVVSCRFFLFHTGSRSKILWCHFVRVLLSQSSMAAIYLSRRPQPRCYQTTSCLWLFSSSLTTFEVLKQLLIGGIREPHTRRKGGWIKVVVVVIPLTTLLWGKGSLVFNLVKGVGGFLVKQWSIICHWKPRRHIKNESVHVLEASVYSIRG